MDKTLMVVYLELKLVPGAPNTAITGWMGDKLKVRVSALPERGKANVAEEDLVAQKLGLANSAVAIVAGHTSPNKRLEITVLDEFTVLQNLGKPGHE